MTHDLLKAQYAAGVLFVHENHMLLMQRASGDHPGTWAFPGGAIEEGEPAHKAARREVQEECGLGSNPQSKLERITTGIERLGCFNGFVCFKYVLSERFSPEINHEHWQWQWCPIERGALPQPMHPNVMNILLQTQLLKD